VTSTATGTPVAAGAAAASRRGVGRLGPRLGAAALSGGLVTVAFPPYDLWPLAPLGVALLVLACAGQAPRRAAMLGLTHGLVTFVPLLSWMTVIGLDAWLLLSLLEASFVAAMAAGLPTVRRLPGAPGWVACLWVAQESVRDRVPFGGFPWGRLAFAETASPLTPFAALGGAPLVTAVTALAGALLAGAVASLTAGPVRRRRAAALTLAVLVAIPAAGMVVGGMLAGRTGEGKRVTAAVVQGGVPGEGLDFFGEREQVLRNHVAATHRLAADVRSGRLAAPDLVIWPENASDIDPFADAGAHDLISAAVRDVGVPVLVGAVVGGPGPDYVRNSAVVWDPQGGPGERYVKRHPVPFGEYIPFRDQLSGWIQRLDQIPRDFYAGARPGNLTVGPAKAGVVICFEVAYDGLVRDVVAGGAALLVVQTNNATYTGTGQPAQQMALSRLRAVEHGRAVLVAATSGISAVVAPDGSVQRRAPQRAVRTLVADVPLREGTTLATRVGAWPEWLLTAAAAGALLVGRRRVRA
jgi:apolipoprotein N-acyltransferase